MTLLLLIITLVIITCYYEFCYYTVITSLLHIITKSLLPIITKSLLHVITSNITAVAANLNTLAVLSNAVIHNAYIGDVGLGPTYAAFVNSSIPNPTYAIASDTSGIT